MAGQLVLSRHRGEEIVIGGNIFIAVAEIRGDKVRIAVRAPEDMAVHRREVYDAMIRKGEDATKTQPQHLRQSASQK